MDIEVLRLFLAVAEEGSFTRAATKLGARQSGLSRQIQRLEQELGAVLLYRNGRGVELTDAGEKLRGVAEETVRSLDRIREELGSQTGTLRGAVTLGLPPSLGASISSGLIRRFQAAHPEARLKVVVAFSGTVLEWLEAGRIDVGVLYDVRRNPTLLSTPLLLEDLYLIEAASAPERPPLAELTELGVGEFVISCSGNGMRRVVDTAAASANVDMKIGAELDSVDAMKELVEFGAERCVLPLGAVHRDLLAGRLRARRFADPQMKALLVSTTPLRQPVTKLTSALIRLVEDEVGACIAQGKISGVCGPELRRMLARPAARAHIS